MAKNTYSSQFRKIDVDGDDCFKDEEQFHDSLSPGIIPVDEKEVISLLNDNKQKEALKLILNSDTIGHKCQNIRNSNFSLIQRVMNSIRVSEIATIVNELNFNEIDILMKFIYRGFENPSDGSSANLLVWHDRAFQKGGVGSIIRVMTDKKRV